MILDLEPFSEGSAIVLHHRWQLWEKKSARRSIATSSFFLSKRTSRINSGNPMSLNAPGAFLMMIYWSTEPPFWPPATNRPIQVLTGLIDRQESKRLRETAIDHPQIGTPTLMMKVIYLARVKQRVIVVRTKQQLQGPFWSRLQRLRYPFDQPQRTADVSKRLGHCDLQWERDEMLWEMDTAFALHTISILIHKEKCTIPQTHHTRDRR